MNNSGKVKLLTLDPVEGFSGNCDSPLRRTESC